MEQNLLQKKANLRAKLIGYQNQISWILCEYEKLKNVKLVDKWIKAKSVALYENLNTILAQINAECYAVGKGIEVMNKNSRLINQYDTVLRNYYKPKSSSSSGGRSGGSSHRSSSGRSHGGGGRRF